MAPPTADRPARNEAVDAIIVGSGAGGGAVAWALCRAGWRVLVLERGPQLLEASTVHDELAVCRRPHFLPSSLDNPNVIVTTDAAGKASEQRSGDGWISSCVGGGTVHMAGYFFRMRPEDFRVQSRHGSIAGAQLADWPFSYDQLAPFYEQAERVIGVSGDAAHEPRRRPGYPLGPLLSHPAGALIDAGCKRVGLRAFQFARAIVSASYDGRPACHYCGFCSGYGCEVHAKSSVPATFLAQAQSTGKLTLRPDTTVVQVTADRSGRASGVITQDPSGARAQIKARVVVVAASAIQSARLLLHSGLANGSGLLGKNLMFVAQAGGWGRFALPDEAHFPPGARRLPFIDRAALDEIRSDDGPMRGTLLFQLPHVNPIFQAERLASTGPDTAPLFGAALKTKLRDFFLETRTLEYEGFADWLPTPDCHVSLDPAVKDPQGMPVARVTLKQHPWSRAATERLAARGRAVLQAAGAREVGEDHPRSPLGRERAYPFLQAGTARMGKNPRDSVLTPQGEAHDVRNLYVADASGFPSSGHAPHTLTIMANALRVAAGIVAKGRAGAI